MKRSEIGTPTRTRTENFCFEDRDDVHFTISALKWSGQGESNPYHQIHSLGCFRIHHAPEKIADIYTYAHFTERTTTRN